MNTAEAADSETSESVLVTGQKTEVVRPENIKTKCSHRAIPHYLHTKWRITMEKLGH